ncbi:MAG: PRC-barrel domain-containing protein [Gammaproteobacteria bacterium]|nr:PRC-barrel domain-containing protein [Gammaproteobacteria bacterium]MBU2222724.1 PRC-barrel domain-containing protein [Gammaproteobacteria bacterium]
MNYQDRDTYGMYKKSHTATASTRGPGPELMGADTLIGNDVHNLAGENLGSIKEIMLDISSGRIAYAVMSFSTYLGFSEKLFAVPWNALTLDTIEKRFVLNVDLERIKDAPGFDRGHWPDMADSNWGRRIEAFYGVENDHHDE